MMTKQFKFQYKENEILVVNSWTRGIKLYVNGACVDKDTRLFAFGKEPMLRANVNGKEILEIVGRSGLVSVEVDAYVRPLNQTKERSLVFSSTKRLSLTSQRMNQPQ